MTVAQAWFASSENTRHKAAGMNLNVLEVSFFIMIICQTDCRSTFLDAGVLVLISSLSHNEPGRQEQNAIKALTANSTNVL